jgi:hypothetical protein
MTNHNDMTPHTRYIVTKPSLDGTFQVNDHIWKHPDGSLMCQEAQGWLINEELDQATKGFSFEFDNLYAIKRKNLLQQELDKLNGIA